MTAPLPPSKATATAHRQSLAARRAVAATVASPSCPRRRHRAPSSRRPRSPRPHLPARGKVSRWSAAVSQEGCLERKICAVFVHLCSARCLLVRVLLFLHATCSLFCRRIVHGNGPRHSVHAYKTPPGVRYPPPTSSPNTPITSPPPKTQDSRTGHVPLAKVAMLTTGHCANNKNIFDCKGRNEEQQNNKNNTFIKKKKTFFFSKKHYKMNI